MNLHLSISRVYKLPDFINSEELREVSPRDVHTLQMKSRRNLGNSQVEQTQEINMNY